MHLVLLEARQVDVQLIRAIHLADVGLHQVLCVLAVQGIASLRHHHAERITEEIIKQVLTKNAGQHKSYLHSN